MTQNLLESALEGVQQRPMCSRILNVTSGAPVMPAGRIRYRIPRGAPCPVTVGRLASPPRTRRSVRRVPATPAKIGTASC